MKLRKKNRLKKKNTSKPRLICQTREPSHETEITSWKINQNKSQNLIFNQTNTK